MPTDTFFNLPQKKRDLILAAAKNEFCRVSFNEASINKIIKDADISRGSFYMYFKDKKDLVYYVLSEYTSQVTKKTEETIKKTHGDIFAVFIELYDSTLAYPTGAMEDIKLLKNLFMSMHSSHLHPSEDIGMREMLAFKKKPMDMQSVMKFVNREILNLKTDDSIEDLILLLHFATKHSISCALNHENDLPTSRARFIQLIDMIKYGVLNEPPDTELES